MNKSKISKRKLNNGMILKGQQCPFISQCLDKKGCPAARSQGNDIDYSCGLARFIDIFRAGIKANI